MKTDIPTNGSMVKNHISLKTGFGYICNTENFVPIVVPGLSSSSSGSSSTSKTPSKQESHSSSSSSSSSSSPTVSEIQIREREDGNNSDISPVQVSNSVDDRSGQPDETTIERGNSLNSEIPEWLQEFRENLVDDEIPVHGGSHASSSHEASLEPTIKRREDLGKHSVYTHFPKDRNCEICKRTKITRAPCRRRNGEAVPRAENFGDLITADHKVLSEIANLETITDMQSWCRTWPPNGSRRIRAKQKLHKKPREACKSSWNPRGSLKSFTLTIPWNSAKLVKISPGIIARLHHIDRRLMGLLKEQCAE